MCSLQGEAVAFALGGNRKMLRTGSLAGLLNQELAAAGHRTAEVGIPSAACAALSINPLHHKTACPGATSATAVALRPGNGMPVDWAGTAWVFKRVLLLADLLLCRSSCTWSYFTAQSMTALNSRQPPAHLLQLPPAHSPHCQISTPSTAMPAQPSTP